MKIMVIGSTGMAGHVIYRYLKEQNHDVMSISSLNSKIGDTSSLQLDITDESNRKVLANLIKHNEPDVVINAIGLLVKACDDNPDKAMLVNAFFPHWLAGLAKKNPFKLVHLSTDCVFSGKYGGYIESSLKDETSMYGVSKSAGEVTYDNHLTIRTSIIGPELKENGIGLMNWFLKQSGKVNGYTNHLWNGVTTLELAKFINYSISLNKIQGLVHINCKTMVSKHEMLYLLKEVYNKDIVLIPTEFESSTNKTIVRTRKDFIYNEKTLQHQLEELKGWY